MDYFLCNNRLSLEEVTDSEMRFVVGDYLTYFDKEMAERMLGNDGSYCYRNHDGRRYTSVPPDDMRKLLHAIFIDETLRIKVCAAYRFRLDGNVSTCGSYSFSHEFADFMPNPHIDRYNCLGNYERTINSMLLEHNYIGALEQCVASCKSLNWGDSTVMHVFMDTMYGVGQYNDDCIELPDGSIVDPVAAIKWLDGQETAVEGGDGAESEETEEKAEEGTTIE